jgi:hypothetical protein
MFLVNSILALKQFAVDTCNPNAGAGSFFGLPTWYKYLPGEMDTITNKCIPTFNSINDVWAIALAVIDILLRVGGLLAVGFVIYGGFRYMTSQGEPDKTSEAKSTILNAIIGLVIIMVAIVAVNFIGSKLGQ